VPAFEDVCRELAEKSRLQAKERHERMLADALASIEKNDRDPKAFVAAARCCKQMGQLHEALRILELGIRRCAPSPLLYEYYVERLEKCNRTEDAIAVAHEAARLFPGELIFRLRGALLLPVFYDSREQINRYRRRFRDGLRRLVSSLPLETAIQRRRALEAIGKNSNKYLPYQGDDVRELQELYGDLVHSIVAVNYPQWTQAVAMAPVDRKIRVGYLSSQSDRFLDTSAAKLFGAWLREQNGQRFEFFAYHADCLADPSAELVRRWNLSFRQLSGEVDEIARAIRRDRLHALIYLDFGQHPRMAQLGSLRLAPVQCVAWDTPLTSGLPTMDYFLSSELMEPQNGQSHYREKLIRLPGVGVIFAKPVIPAPILTKTRRDFGLRGDAVVYLSGQSIFKFLPEQDELVARIAQQVPASQFVFLVTNDLVANDFRNRMDRAFARLGLRAGDHCVWLAEMNIFDYWNLHRVADVFLDTLGWSAGVACFEAVACGLPVVTLPGALMRSRHSCGILTQLGVTETIARDAASYVQIATRLGVDRRWRQNLVERMVAVYAHLYSDSRSVRPLEDFLDGAVSERSRQSRGAVNQSGEVTARARRTIE
jgi:protein O-GlcNAc transferase